MTKLMEEAFAAVAKLPEDEQNAIAALVVEEMTSEKRWSELFAASQDQLAHLADEALRDWQSGKTKPFPD
ncbi:MAG TPA: hypothetical protein VMT32_04905 [Bryobacteraceae bacterium]|nr:hypothetical protein [Bryobacteraceae bacterium]